MEVGDKVTFKFGKAKKTMEGKIIRLFEKSVYLRVEFPHHNRNIYRKGKLVREVRDGKVRFYRDGKLTREVDQKTDKLAKVIRRKRHQLTAA